MEPRRDRIAVLVAREHGIPCVLPAGEAARPRPLHLPGREQRREGAAAGDGAGGGEEARPGEPGRHIPPFQENVVLTVCEVIQTFWYSTWRPTAGAPITSLSLYVPSIGRATLLP